MYHPPTLHLIAGQAGAGKTTYAKHLETSKEAIRFSKDEWIISLYGRSLPLAEWSRCEQRCYTCIESVSGPLLKRGVDVIWDYGFWYREERLKAHTFASKFGAHCLIHYLATPTDVRRTRVLNRNLTESNDSVVILPDDFEKQLGWFEPPSEEEGIMVNLVSSSEVMEWSRSKK